MHLKKVLIGVMLFSAIGLQGQSVNISGTVVTSLNSLPIQNATVSLVNQGVSTQTDIAGRYVFLYTSTINNYAGKSAMPGLRFAKSSLSFTLDKNDQLVRIDVFGINGKHLRTVVHQKLQRGTHSFPLSGAMLSSQMYLIVFSVDGTAKQYRYLNIPGMYASGTTPGGMREPPNNAGLARAGTKARLAPAVDTIKVVKTGYLRVQRPIESYVGVHNFYLDTICPAVIVTVLEDSTLIPIVNADVVIYNANTNAGITRAFTDSNGTCQLYVQPNMTCYLKVAAQNYKPSPPRNGVPQPFMVGDSGSYNYREVILKKDKLAATCGAISGFVTSTLGVPVPGALVIAIRQSDSITISGFSGPDGMYILFNVPEGTYEMQAFLAGWYQATRVTNIGVTRQTVTSGANIQLTANAGTSLSGRITFLASQNSEVDVTLTHIISKEAIPGLNAMTISQNYAMDSIPPGIYVPWASYQNDGYVMDPDWIRKFGLPTLTFPLGGGPQTLNFSVTGAITIISPTNSPDTIVPIAIYTDTPTFVWTSYPSTQEYVIAVYNSYGDIVWGGYDTSGNILHATIGSKDTSARYNFDGSATEPLKWGCEYRWKIWADKGVQAGVQQLLSSSEDLMGLFCLPYTSRAAPR